MESKYQQIQYQPLEDFSAKVLRSLLTLVILVTGLDGLRDVRLEGPRYIRQGENVVLHCNYKLDNDSLYVIKWYRGSEEFYRFVPKEVPPKKFFTYPGLSFNELYCNEHDAVLKNVVLETSGKFKCAVSAEHTFQTFVASQDLTVVVIDYNGPRLEVEQLSYYPGETGNANCSLGKVSHPLNFTWFINDQEVPRSASKEVTIADPEEPSLSRSMSLIQFEVGSSSPSPTPANTNTNVTSTTTKVSGGGAGEMRLRCRAELFDLYSELSQEFVIQTTQPRYSLSNQDTLRRSSAAINRGDSQHPSSTMWRSSILLLILLLFQVIF